MEATPPSPHVFDATEANFEADVVEASFAQPVLVDLWATWCEPCKALGPLLEKVVADFNGAVKLAKVDCDAQPALAASFGVRSIPTVVLLRDGQLADVFTGALPEGEIRQFLLRHVQPNESVEQADAEISEPVVEETPAETITRLTGEIAAQPERDELKLDLAVAHMQHGDADSAAALLDALPASLSADDRARRVRGQLDFAAALKDAPMQAELQSRIERDDGDLAARDLLGVRLLVQGDAIGALEQFLNVLRADRQWNDGQAKKRLVAAFGVIDDEEIVGAYRRKMSSLLF